MRSPILKLLILIVAILVVLGGLFLYFKMKGEPEVSVDVPVEEVKKVEVVYKLIGTSVEGRKIESFTYGSGDNHVVFVGGIHGGYEWNSVLLAYQLIDYLYENYSGKNATTAASVIAENVQVTIIPSANPDGVFKVVGKEGRFVVTDVSTNSDVLASARFNANDVDLNRNFDCKWQPESKWQSKTVSAGTSAFSEPEALAIKNFVTSNKPDAFVFWHSQANAVYSSECEEGVLPATTEIMNLYATASGYEAAGIFDSYVVTGDAADWLATLNIPAITVELKTHEAIEWEKNLAGVKALLAHFAIKN